MSEMGQGTKQKNTISMLMVGFQSPGIILWSRHRVGGLSLLGLGLRSLSALVYCWCNTGTVVKHVPPTCKVSGSKSVPYEGKLVVAY